MINTKFILIYAWCACHSITIPGVARKKETLLRIGFRMTYAACPCHWSCPHKMAAPQQQLLQQQQQRQLQQRQLQQRQHTKPCIYHQYTVKKG
jgi:hypothetical protein